MMFTTFGTQLPFERLIRTLDEWARDHAQTEVFAQIGQTTYVPKHMQWSRTITPDQFQSYVAESEVIVAHAGMGTIISAVELGKRVVVMPRREALGEHRNDHQLDTANRFSHLQGLSVVHDGVQLSRALAKPRGDALDAAVAELVAQLAASPDLITQVRQFAGLEAA
jgi:UDP-N-acetylglucosamine transferase subunit ALG13